MSNSLDFRGSPIIIWKQSAIVILIYIFTCYNYYLCILFFSVCGEVEALETVLSAGAEPSTPDIHGGYPIHYASQMCGHASEMGNDVRVGE